RGRLGLVDRAAAPRRAEVRRRGRVRLERLTRLGQADGPRPRPPCLPAPPPGAPASDPLDPIRSTSEAKPPEMISRGAVSPPRLPPGRCVSAVRWSRDRTDRLDPSLHA